MTYGDRMIVRARREHVVLLLNKSADVVRSFGMFGVNLRLNVPQ